MGAYDTLIYNFQDPDADHVAIHPKFNALFTESELLPVVLEGYADARNTIAELENERDAALNTCTLIAETLGITGAVADDTIARAQQLVGENTALTDKAASELSNAWLLHRTMMGAQAALFCITQGNLGQAREWLGGTTDEAQLEIPDGMEVNGLQDWFDENMVEIARELLSQREQNLSLSRQLDVMTAAAQALRDEMYKGDAKLAAITAAKPEALPRHIFSMLVNELRDVPAIGCKRQLIIGVLNRHGVIAEPVQLDPPATE
ncbi:hypothetical protein V1956_19540 [Yersinia sp. 2540 StPb PI]|uniref:hypothetical protein n=1 Tax=Yersinia sp. 2540 StPb PI TaxID=3117406 RepID=UPI003FA46032